MNHPPASADLGEEHDDHGGLHRDIPNLVGRRDILRMMGGVSLVGLLAACGVTGGEGTATTSTSSARGATTSRADSFSRLSLDSDMAFADGWSDQLAMVRGSPDAGYTASLLVRV